MRYIRVLALPPLCLATRHEFRESKFESLLTAKNKGSNKIKAVFHTFRHVLSIMCVSSLQKKKENLRN